MIQRILVATDGSDHARKAIELASDIAKRNHSSVYLMHVVHEPKVPEGVAELVKQEHIPESPSCVHIQVLAERILGPAKRMLKGRGIGQVFPVMADGKPADKIIEFARNQGVDLIVMGTRGLSRLGRLFLGSISDQVRHLAPCTCITVK